MSQGNWENWKTENDYDDEELEEAEEQDATKDALVFAIEATPDMLEPRIVNGVETDSALVSTLQCALDLMKRKVIISREDLVGIVIFNCQERKASTSAAFSSSEHIYTVRDLEPLTADGIQEVKALVDSAKKDPSGFREKFHAKSDDSPSVFADVIRFCGGLLKDKAAKAGCRIFLVTDNDDPFPLSSSSGRQLRDVTKTHVVDIAEMKTQMIPFFISNNGKEFDTSKFYRELFQLLGLDLDDEDTLASCLLDASADKDMYAELKAQTAIRQSTKRAQFTIPFVLGEGLEIGIQGFSLISEMRKGPAIQLDTSGRDVREVKQVLTYDDKDLARPLNPKTEIKPYFAMGGKGSSPAVKVVFTCEEVKLLKNLGLTPGLYLLGFTELEHFACEDQIKHAYFIYPHEEAIKSTNKTYPGSKRAFTSLLLTLLDKGKIGLGVLLPRTNSTPCHVLIVPQKEKRGQNNDPSERQEVPPGFHLIQLAFADDLRSINVDSSIACVTADDEEESVGSRAQAQVSQLLKRIRQTYDPDRFPNPSLNHHYECLGAIALKEDLPEVDDRTVPLYHSIKTRAGDMIASFNDLIAQHPKAQAGQNKAAVASKSPKKRKRESDDEEEKAEVDGDHVIALFKAGTEKKLKVDELKNYCRVKKLKTTGKKDDLMGRIRDYCACLACGFGVL